MSKPNPYEQAGPFILFILALALLFFFIKPLITLILGSVLLAYISFPLYAWFHKKLRKKTISIILALLSVTALIILPFAVLTFEVAREGYFFYESLTSYGAKGALLGYSCVSAESQVCDLVNQGERYTRNTLSKFGLDTQLQAILPVLKQKLASVIFSIPLILAKIFLAIVIAFFLLQDRKAIKKQFIAALPVRTKTADKLVDEFESITHTVIYSQLFVALVQGVIGTIGFWLFGVPLAVLLGVILAFAALIPTIGTAIIWFPASLYLMLVGYSTGNHVILAKGIGLFLYGMLIISTIDNVLLAKIVHTRAKVNQILVIIGVLGGGIMFGFIGIFIGPILLPLLITYLQSFKERYDDGDG